MERPNEAEPVERFRRRAGDFQDLMREQVRNVLFVSSLYESFIMAEDRQLNELVLSKFLDLNLGQAPNLTQVSTGGRALALARAQHRFDLLVTTMQAGDMSGPELARRVRAEGLPIPVILLAYDHRDVAELNVRHPDSGIERAFLWQGDAGILLAIVKYVEDRLNAAHDTRVGVPVLLVVEDNVRYYSSFLPVIYGEVMRHAQSVFSEGANLSQKLLRMRARPKILLCTSFEEAWGYFSTFREDVLGVISDIEFPRKGTVSPTAGADLGRMIRRARHDLPIVLQSSYPENARVAERLGASFLLKDSPTMLHDLRRILAEQFFFGDFVFRMPDGGEVGRATDVKTLVRQLRTVPGASIEYHGSRNDFSAWLRTRAEFDLAFKLRPRRVTDYASEDHLRGTLIDTIDQHRRQRDRSTVADFDPDGFDGTEGLVRIGGGSLGGKARGLAFAMRLLDRSGLADRFPGVHLAVPPGAVLATEIFDEFLEQNALRDAALETGDDGALAQRFLEARLPEAALRSLAVFAERVRHPLAVRSSSLLEDSPHQSFAGIFDTWMLPNDHPHPRERLARLVAAIKRVYASTYFRHSRAFLRTTPYRLEEEHMAVAVQKVVGARRDRHFYPDFAGVARSHNFYPLPPARNEDGVAAVGLGFGRTVVDGEPCVRFCPAYPRHLLDFSTPEEALRYSQRDFWALRVGREEQPRWGPSGELVRVPLEAAERHGVLGSMASTYSPENDAVYDGLARDGVRLVSFAPILKHGAFPLAEILKELLDVGAAATGSSVEIEFAVNLAVAPGAPSEFGFLQLRPLSLSGDLKALQIEDLPREALLCQSPAVLGNGRVENIRDVVVVDRRTFDRARSLEAAAALAHLNADLAGDERPYLLVGVGRWGSSHPRLGIPVKWDDIHGARVIVESGFHDFRVTPSQGTHFFQNLVSAQVGYFTVNEELGEGFVDWGWLAEQPAARTIGPVRHLRFDAPLRITMNGKENRGIVVKPGAGA
jgi:CheY-like chemotaxis protein